MMKQRFILYWATFLVVAAGPLFLSFWAFAGTITTSLTCRKTVKSNGDLELHMELKNNGDATAYSIVVTLMLADIVKKYDNLGNNAPGGKIAVEEKLVDPELKPGAYVAVIRVDFEEENGAPHRVYHMVPIAYLANEAEPFDPSPSLELTAPEFNRKAFWDTKGDIALHVKNEGREKLVLKTSLFLPEGVGSPAPNATLRLTPKSEKAWNFPVQLTGNTNTVFPYHVVASYESERFHHSRLLAGKIMTVERPIYFKWFVMGSGVFLGILFLLIVAGLIARGHRERGQYAAPPLD